MQNNQIDVQALTNAINNWRNTPTEQREEHIRNLYKSQHLDYEQEKARVLEAVRNKDPRIMRLINTLQQFVR